MAAKQITRREMIGGMGGAVLSSSLAPAALAAPKPRKRGGKPNVIFITAEGVPLSVLSCYGSKLMSTPHIDRLASEGMRFEHSFCTNALCAPSRATLLTGKYSHQNGMISNPPDTTAWCYGRCRLPCVAANVAAYSAAARLPNGHRRQVASAGKSRACRIRLFRLQEQRGWPLLRGGTLFFATRL